MARRRHLSRIAVMSVLFERERRDEIDTKESLARDLKELGGGDEEFAKELLAEIIKREDEIREVIRVHAPDWSLDRMDPIARCTLLVGACELLFISSIPPAVAMNEAIDIAKDYGNEESGKFVNGVLNAIAAGKK
jgi:transcription antitermination protein NusB